MSTPNVSRDAVGTALPAAGVLTRLETVHVTGNTEPVPTISPG